MMKTAEKKLFLITYMEPNPRNIFFTEENIKKTPGAKSGLSEDGVTFEPPKLSNNP